MSTHIAELTEINVTDANTKHKTHNIKININAYNNRKSVVSSKRKNQVPNARTGALHVVVIPTMKQIATHGVRY